MNHGHTCTKCGKKYRCSCLIAGWEPKYRPTWKPLCKRCEAVTPGGRLGPTYILPKPL